MAEILLIATGGTIASTAAASGGSVTAKLGGQDLLAGIAIPEGVSVSVKSIFSLGSNAITLEDILILARDIEAELPRYDGIVVTHGTDTMEETAFMLELLLAPQKPVILTGAQRHAGEADTDGPRNLRDAIFAAAQPAMAGMGVTILFEGDIHAARYVRKTHTSRVDTFRSGDFGKLGAVDAGQLRLAFAPRRGPALGTSQDPKNVLLIAAAMGMGPELLDFAGQSAADGVIVQGFGRGNFPKGWANAAKDLISEGKKVVVTSRCPEGEVAAIYGNDSGGTLMEEVGCWFAGDLSAYKARILLAFVLTLPEGDQAEVFRAHCGPQA